QPDRTLPRPGSRPQDLDVGFGGSQARAGSRGRRRRGRGDGGRDRTAGGPERHPRGDEGRQRRDRGERDEEDRVPRVRRGEQGRGTDDGTVATLVEFVRGLGKVPVVVADSPGFLVNRILFPYLDEAVRLVIEGIPADEVDRAAVRFGMPTGPLELLDQVGVDVAADVSGTFAPPAGNDVGPSPERFAAMVRDGALGKK